VVGVRIIGCVPVYNEELLLEDCLGSLEGRVDALLIIDGAYKEFDGDNTASTDGTLEIIERFAESSSMPVYCMPAKEWASPPEKFDNFFHMFEWKEGDWMLLVDADDRIEATDEEWEQFRMCLELVPEMYPDIFVGSIRYLGLGDNINAELPTRRLIRWFDGVGYGSNHWTWVDTKTGRVLDEGKDAQVINTGLVLRRMEHLRTRERMVMKQTYDERVRPNVEEMKRY